MFDKCCQHNIDAKVRFGLLIKVYNFAKIILIE